MRTIALRLRPGADLKAELLALAAREGVQAGWVLTCVGSLSRARLRLASGAEVVVAVDDRAGVCPRARSGHRLRGAVVRERDP
jgi:predicted DNA-binding protein with PD1-like motif